MTGLRNHSRSFTLQFPLNPELVRVTTPPRLLRADFPFYSGRAQPHAPTLPHPSLSRLFPVLNHSPSSSSTFSSLSSLRNSYPPIFSPNSLSPSTPGTTSSCHTLSPLLNARLQSLHFSPLVTRLALSSSLLHTTPSTLRQTSHLHYSAHIFSPRPVVAARRAFCYRLAEAAS